MTFQVFQVDTNPDLAPYTVEQGILGAAGGRIVLGECRTEDEVIERAAGCEVLWLQWGPNITRRVMEALASLRLAVRWGVGFEQMDLDAATDLGVAIANSPGYGTDDVAETAMALLLTVSRRTAFHHEQMLHGAWPASIPGSVHRLRGRTLGLIGSGRIGSSVARMAAGFGLRVIGHDLVRTPAELAAAGIEAVDMDTLLVTSDYVSLHVPYTPGTHHLVDAALLTRLKPGAILVNTARGKVVDTAALIDALANGHLAGAGLDVFEQEPLPADSPLRSAPNVVMTPHVAGFSVEAFADLRAEMCRTTIEFMATGWAGTIVRAISRPRFRWPQRAMRSAYPGGVVGTILAMVLRGAFLKIPAAPAVAGVPAAARERVAEYDLLVTNSSLNGVPFGRLPIINEAPRAGGGEIEGTVVVNAPPGRRHAGCPDGRHGAAHRGHAPGRRTRRAPGPTPDAGGVPEPHRPAGIPVGDHVPAACRDPGRGAGPDAGRPGHHRTLRRDDLPRRTRRGLRSHPGPA